MVTTLIPCSTLGIASCCDNTSKPVQWNTTTENERPIHFQLLRVNEKICRHEGTNFGHYSADLRYFHLLLLLHRHRIIYRFVPRIQVEAKWNVTTLINTSWGLACSCSIMLLNTTRTGAHRFRCLPFSIDLDWIYIVPAMHKHLVPELLACRLPVFATDSLRFPQTSSEWNSCSPACCAAGKNFNQRKDWRLERTFLPRKKVVFEQLNIWTSNLSGMAVGSACMFCIFYMF